MVADDREFPGFVAIVGEIDLRQPLTGADEARLRVTLNTYPVVVFHDQFIDNDQEVAFAARFGPIDENTASRRHRLNRTDLVDISNLNDDETIFARDDARHLFSLANQLWHTDASFKEPAAAHSMLACHVTPSWGGETEFADLRAAYDALSPRMQERIEDLVAEHAFIHSRRILGFDAAVPAVESMPAVLHPVVHTHTGSGRKSLYLASHASRILGWPVPEGRLLLFELIEHATQPQFVYRHSWSPGDFVIYDNRCSMHRGRPFDMQERRDLRRATTRDETGTLTVGVPQAHIEGRTMAYDLDHFSADLHAILTAKGPAGLPEIATKLSDLLRNPAFVAATFEESTPPGHRVLYHDAETDAFVLAHVQVPGKAGTPHSHGPSWAIYGNARGFTDMAEWRRVNPPDEDRTVLTAAEHYRLGPGDTHAYGPEAIHSTAHPEKAWVIRVTGTDLDRLTRWRFNPTKDEIVESVATAG